MNYTLQIDLVGADKADAVLDKIIKTVGSIGATPKMSFDKWLSAGDGEKVGEQAGKSFVKGFKAYGLKDLPKLWGQAMTPNTPEFFKNLFTENGKAKKIDEVLPKPDWKKMLIGAGLGFSNPYIGSRLLSDELGKGGAGAGGIAGGLFGKGGIAGFSEIFLAFKTFKIAVDLFSKIVSSALEKAFNIYTQAAQAGLNVQFFTQRQALAGLLGVSGNPNQIFMFGKAVQELAARSAFATGVISSNARSLFATSVNFKLLKLDLDALYSEIASKLAPALNVAAFALGVFINSLTKFISKIFQIGKDLIVFEALLGDKSAQALLKLIDAAGKIGGTSPLMSGMKQLPASSWEHMGLAIGAGANTTNDLIKHSNKYLSVIANAVTMHGSGASGQFGLSATTSNP